MTTNRDLDPRGDFDFLTYKVRRTCQGLLNTNYSPRFATKIRLTDG